MGTSRFVTLGTVVLATALQACANDGGVVELGEVRVTLQRSDERAGATTELRAERGRTTAPSVVRDTIEALTATVTRIEFLAIADPADTSEAGGWIALTLDRPATIDLLDLPAEHELALVIAAGSIPVGAYRNVRLFVIDAAIVFKGSVLVGTTIFEGGVPYPVRIPSSDQSGIKTDAGFSVGEQAGEVNLLFAESATLANLTATGSGRVQMAPVLRTRSQNHE